jgi:hypothetical protein
VHDPRGLVQTFTGIVEHQALSRAAEKHHTQRVFETLNMPRGSGMGDTEAASTPCQTTFPSHSDKCPHQIPIEIEGGMSIHTKALQK